MALIKCPECGQNHSKYDTKCPNCGYCEGGENVESYPNKSGGISPKAIIGVAVAVVAVAVAFIAIDNATLSKKNAEWEAEQIEKYGDTLDNIAQKSEEKKDELFEASESRMSEVSALAEAETVAHEEEEFSIASYGGIMYALPDEWIETEVKSSGYICYYADDTDLLIMIGYGAADGASNEELLEHADALVDEETDAQNAATSVVDIGTGQGIELNYDTSVGENNEPYHVRAIFTIGNDRLYMCVWEVAEEAESDYTYEYEMFKKSLYFTDIDEEEQDTGEAEAPTPLEDYQYSEPFFTYSGTGDDVITGVTTDGLSYAHITGGNDRYFSVKGYYDNTYDLLVNTTDPYDGATLIYGKKEYTFEVSATGDWTIELYKIGASSADIFEGTSDYITPIFMPTSNVYEITTSGDGYFAVKGWDDTGYDLLVNTTDADYAGKVLFEAKGDYAFFEITASRDWSITPVE